ncbi:MAG: thiamine-phosphate kinase, partial [Myxococcales bacterium]|nr:thiamine-phosphate kinase [Myxococcales bacterium]
SEAQSSESQLVGVLSRVFRHDAAAPNVMLGIGDDAACLRFTGKLVVSVDAQVEGTHFRLEWLDLKDLGFRSFQAAISDLAAMGATPVAAVSHLTLPADFRPAELRRLSLGQEQAAAATACPVIGGNLSRGSELSVVTTVLGRAKRYVTRSGARPGDEVWLLGEIGLARAGLELLLSESKLRTRAARRALAAWRRPMALLEEGRALVGRARACLDVSDGLGQDVKRLADASGVRIDLDQQLVRRALPPELEALERSLGWSALELARQGGEDYALLATGPAKRRPKAARVIGAVRQGKGAWIDEGGRLRPLEGGFDHFRAEK